VADDKGHRFNNPDLHAREFLLAVMHDRTVPLGQRIEAAVKLLPLIEAHEYPASREVVLTIKLAPYPEQLEHEVGFGPRDEAEGLGA
jgi:hypothetical protein